MSTDFRGDPSAALLEVLDPEQNSDVQRSLPRSRLRPLRRHVHHDGELPARDPDAAAGPHGDHPAPRLHRVREGLDRRAVPDPQAEARQRHRRTSPVDFAEDAVRDVIHHYTKEAGVRNLEREIATVCRKIARDVVAKKAPVARQRRRHAGLADHAQAAAALPRRRTSSATARRRSDDEIGLVQRPGGHHVRRRPAGDRGLDRRRARASWC